MASKQPRIVIAGAGIGGLACALALHARGFRNITVLEAASQMHRLGVGINIQPPAIAELSLIGLGDELERAGIRTRAMMYSDLHGSELETELRGVAAGHRFPQYSLHRGDLQQLLLEATRDRLGEESIVLGSRVVGFRDAGNAVVVQWCDTAANTSGTIATDVLVAADGLHSRVRAQLHPDAMALRKAHVQMWRGVTELDRFLDGRTMIVANDNDTRRLIAYPISASHAQRGTPLVNWVCLIPDALLSADILNASRGEEGRAEDILEQYRHWDMGWLDIGSLFGGSAHIYRDAMVDRPPLAYWGVGRVTLLGDAAHLMYPVGANGGTQAILDAFTLADALAETADVTEALSCYEALRRPATSQIVQANRQRDSAERALADHSAQEKSAALAGITRTYNAIVERPGATDQASISPPNGQWSL